MDGQMSLNLFQSGLPRDDKYRYWNKELVKERIINDEKLQQYLIEDSTYAFNCDLVVLYDYSDDPILNKYRTVIFDAKQGIVLTRRCSRQMLNELFKDELFINLEFQKQLNNMLGYKYLHVVSCWQYAYFALHGYSEKNTDWLGFHQMCDYECQRDAVMFTTKKLDGITYEFTFNNCCRHLAKRISEAIQHNHLLGKIMSSYFAGKDWLLPDSRRWVSANSLLTDDRFVTKRRSGWYSQFQLNGMLARLHQYRQLSYGQVYAECYDLPFNLQDHKYFYQKSQRRRSIY